MDTTLTESAQRVPDHSSKSKHSPRRWLLRFVAVLLGFAPLLLIELSLRLFGIGNDLSLIIPVQKAPGWYRLNPQFDEPFFGRTILSGPENRPFQLPKPPSTRRILVIGGSTVVGYPYDSELAFPRHLEAALALQSDGQETVEVLNAGITAISSSIEVALVEEGLKTEPDAIVVYSGHNEFYGAGAVAVSTKVLAPKWLRFVARWRRLYLLQAVRRFTKPRKPPVDLIEWLPDDVHIEQDGKVFEKGLTAYRDNLHAMAELAGRANIPIVFVSPVANEHDQPPIENLKGISNSDAEGWRASLQAGERELTWGKLPKAIELLEALAQKQDRNPEVHFRLAQAYDKAERREDSVKQYSIALDLDGCRFRAPSVFRSTMADVARQHESTGARFVNLHQAICNESDSAVPGRKHFLEHVHFTWEGNRLTGTVIANFIWREIWSREWSTERELDQSTAAEKLAVLDEDHMSAFATVIGFYLKMPFREGVDSELLAKELTRESAILFQRLPVLQQKKFVESSRRQSSESMFDKLIESRMATGDTDLIGNWFRARMIRQPWRCDWSNDLTNWLRKRGEILEGNRVQKESQKWPCGSFDQTFKKSDK